MAKKFIKRWTPDPAKVRENPSLHFMGDLLHDPNLFHLNRHSVSVAFFVGIFTAFLPVPGQMPIAAFAALLFRCNLPLSVVLVWISNPLTIGPMFFATYKLGTVILDTPPIDFSFELSWQWLSTEFQKIWQPLLTGSLVSGAFFGTLGYFTMSLFWRWQVVRNWEKRKAAREEKNKAED